MSDTKKINPEGESMLNEMLRELDKQLGILYDNSERLHRVSYQMRDHRVEENDAAADKSFEPTAFVDKLSSRIGALKYYNNKLEADITNLEYVV